MCYVVAHPTKTVTVDRISNSGNAIAKDRVQGKVVHAPVRDVGETLEVKLIDRGSHFEAKLVDRTEETQPRQPSLSPDTSDMLDSGSKESHSFEVRPRLTKHAPGKERRSKMSSRKK